MSALERLVGGQLTFTLHRSDPGPSGSGVLTRRVNVNGAAFRVTNGTLVNVTPVLLEGQARGRATWIALWLDGVVAARNRLVEPVDVLPGAAVPFARGDLRIGWPA